MVLLGEASPLPVTYAGGARSIEDLERVTELGKGKVWVCIHAESVRGTDQPTNYQRTACAQVDLTIGSALDIFGGELSYRDVVEWDKRNGYI